MRKPAAAASGEGSVTLKPSSALNGVMKAARPGAFAMRFLHPLFLLFLLSSLIFALRRRHVVQPRSFRLLAARAVLVDSDRRRASVPGLAGTRSGPASVPRRDALWRHLSLAG